MKNISEAAKRRHTKRIQGIIVTVRNKYNIHGRPFTLDDFYRICVCEGIELWRDVDVHSTTLYEKYPMLRGSHLRAPLSDGSFWHAIWLRSFFEEQIDEFTAFHELGHYFAGHRGGLRDERRIQDPQEFEADTFAEYCLKWGCIDAQ